MIARTSIEAMKGNPLALALVLVNLMFLAVGLYVLRDLSNLSRERDSRRDELLTTLVNNCIKVEKGT